MSSPQLPGHLVLGPPRTGSWMIVPTPGPKGDQGDPGTPGGSYFVHVQATPAATWIINHNLAKKVHVTLFDTSDVVFHADLEHGSINQVTVTFPGPTVGSAFIS